MDGIKLLAELIRDCPENIFFTGAGISTESGIPDYRSPGSGLWTKPEAARAVEIRGFLENPRAFYEVFSGSLYAPFAHAEPNIAHRYIAMLEASGFSDGVITQNIDGLHKRAGSETVYELHGTMSSSSCVVCGKHYETDQVFDRFLLDGACPECGCGGVIKPDIVFFGETLPEEVLADAFAAAAACRLFIVAGSSLSVMPANLLPRYAKEHGAELVIINKTETPLDYMASTVINKGIGEVFTELDKLWKKAE